MADAGTPAISVRGLSKHYDQVRAVDQLDLDIEDGEFFSMLGPSGSGKTTVLRLIAGFEQPTAGSVKLGDEDVTRRAPYDRDVNTVFQDYAIFPHMSVLQNVEYGLRVKKVPRAKRRTRAEEALATVRLEGYAARRPHQLSGGQRQRVALGRLGEPLPDWVTGAPAAATSARLELGRGMRLCVSVRARDGVGTWSDWSGDQCVRRPRHPR